jgi:L-arabinose transport system permease protein
MWETSGMLLVLVAMAVAASCTIDNFASWNNLVGLLQSVTTVGFVSCTMMLCLASGDFDLSVGSTAALAGMLCVLTMNHFVDQPATAMLLGIGAAFFAGAFAGLANGLLIAKANINALIATLGTMQILRGRAFLSSDGVSVGSKVHAFNELGKLRFFQSADFQGVPVSVFIMIGFFVIFGVLLNRTTFGRNTLAIGGNKEAARLAGIAVDRTKILIFVLQGIAAAFAGVVMASQQQAGDPKWGQGLELNAISACVLGGVSLTGGVGSMSGVVIGLLIMGTTQNALNLMSVSSFHQYEVNGGILLAAVVLDSLKQKLRK